MIDAMTKKNIPINIILSISIMIMTGVFMIKTKDLPPQIPLFYSRLEGDDQIADLSMIFLLPFLSLFMVFVNNFIVKKYFSDNDFIRQITYYVNLTIICLILFIFLRIIFLVI